MTLVIALRCIDGLVMASDSQGTEETGSIRYNVPKIFSLTDRSVWGGSGQGQVIREIGASLEQARELLTASPNIGQSLVSIVRPVLDAHYRNYLPAPGLPLHPPATNLLACGLGQDDQPWVVEVDARCQYTHYEDRGFHAIGSGAGFAQMANSLMAHYGAKDRPLSHGMLIAYRAMAAAIETSGFGIGGPIQMWEIRAEGVRELPDDELEEVRNNVGGWIQEDNEALDSWMGAGREAGEPTEEDTPLPPEVPNEQ